MAKDDNKTKYDMGDTHGREELQLSSRSWNKIEAYEYDPASEHSAPEVLLLREAVKYLTPKQRKVWEYHAYDKLTQDEIAQKVQTSRQMVQQHLQAAERRIAKWCKSNMGAYKLMQSSLEESEED